jgi:hypothetical protein
MSDFYQDSAQRRLQQIEAERAAAMADLAAHRLNSDYDSAGQVIQQVANLDSERANLTALYQRYVAENTPRQPEQRTQEELEHLPWNKMTPDDGLQLAKRRNTAATSTGLTRMSETVMPKRSAAGIVGNKNVRPKSPRPLQHALADAPAGTNSQQLRFN